jgi:hypothetical protein
MRTLVVFALCTLLAAGFAGCSGKSDSSTSASGTASASTSAPGTGSQSGTATGTGTGSASATSSSGTAANHAPVVNVFTVNKTAGAAPLKVAFKLNATDADQDKLTYTLAFGDATANVTGSLPAADATHTFSVAGNYTARLVVSDGKAAVNKTLLLHVASAAAAAIAPVTFTGHFIAPDPSATDVDRECAFALFGALFESTIGVGTENKGLGDYQTFPAGATLTGWSSTINIPDSLVQYVDSSVGYVGDPNPAKVPDGAAGFLACGNGPTAVNADYTLTLSPP